MTFHGCSLYERVGGQRSWCLAESSIATRWMESIDIPRSMPMAPSYTSSAILNGWGMVISKKKGYRGGGCVEGGPS